MGQSWSEIWGTIPEATPDPHKSPSPERDFTEQYTIISTADSVLEFDPNKSYAVCVGIDKQLDDRFNGKSLGYIAAKDAVSLSEAFIADMGLQRDRVNVYTTTDVSYLCKKGALSTLFVNYARKVGDDGIFIFHFSGHGVLVKGGNNEWVLAPADFSGDVVTGISADDLLQLIQVADCRARHVLIILDCCYAGGIGGKMASDENVLKVKPGVYVLCACAAKEVSLALAALGNSIFTFFLLHYFEKRHSKGKFDVKGIMTEVTELCRCFSTLMMRYTEETGLKSTVMQPEVDTLAVIEVATVIADEPDSNRFSLLFSLYDRDLPKPSLHKAALRWLRSSPVQRSLETLRKKTSLPLPLRDGVLCAMMYSVACLHLEHDRSHIVERNFVITATVNVLAAIGFEIPDVTISLSSLKMAMKYYYKPIFTLGIPAKPIERLWLDLCSVEDGMETRADQTDSGQNPGKDQLKELYSLPQWEPIT